MPKLDGGNQQFCVRYEIVVMLPPLKRVDRMYYIIGASGLRFDIKKWYWNKHYNFKYRKCDEDVCCCGSSNCEGDSSHSYVNAKEYYIDSINNCIHQSIHLN